MKKDSRRTSRWTAFRIALLPWCVAGCGITLGTMFPDQSLFAPLSDLAASGQAVVRLYGRPIRGIELIAIHPTFVVKRADATQIEIWEVQPFVDDDGDHVIHVTDPDEIAGRLSGAQVIAELTGAMAEPVIDFIETESPRYSCHETYFLLGPNSNTYAQWVLDQTGWEVTLPPTSIGKDASPVCRLHLPS